MPCQPCQSDTPSGRVFDIERFALHNGPGIRTTVFLKGCPLHCPWCHNPESRSSGSILLWTAEKCAACGQCQQTCPRDVHKLTEQGHEILRERCETCGACVETCATGALEIAGRQMTVEDTMREIMRDAPFYQRSGGGLTISGGEPLTQYGFTLALLQAAKSRNMHTALDTSGFCPGQLLDELSPHVDLFLYDIKHMDANKHQSLTGVSNDRILENLRRLDERGNSVWIRLPLIPGQNDDDTNYHRIGRFLTTLKHVERVEILGYHRLAESKYDRMGDSYSLRGLSAPPADLGESRRKILVSLGLTNVIWRE